VKLSNKLFWIVILIGFTGLSAHNYLGPEHEKHLDHPVKGEHNPHPGWVPREMRHSGGPDSFGYVFLDSHEPDGPEFFYLFPDGETITDMGDDAYSGPIQLPLNLHFMVRLTLRYISIPTAQFHLGMAVSFIIIRQSLTKGLQTTLSLYFGMTLILHLVGPSNMAL